MAERVRIEHIFDCREETFWNLFLDDEYNNKLFTEHLGFARWEVAKRNDTPERLERLIVVEPSIGDIPGPVKKVVGDKIVYKEDGYLDKAKQHYHVTVIPGVLPKKVSIQCEQWTEPFGDGTQSCKRIFTANIDVKVFGIGGVIEKIIAKELRKSYDVDAKYTNAKLKEKEAEG